MTNRASYDAQTEEVKKRLCCAVRFAGKLHPVYQPDKLLAGVGDGNIIMLSFSTLLGEICLECRIPETNVLCSIKERISQVSGSPFLHVRKG